MGYFADSFAAVRFVRGETITYRRGIESCSLRAVPGSLLGAAFGEQNLVIDSQSFDFIFFASDLALTDPLPKAGDFIERANGEKFLVAEGLADSVWRYHDPDSVTIRVHSKRMT